MRTVVREPTFDQQLSKLFLRKARADEFIEAAEWALSRDPMIGKIAGIGSSVWLLSFAPNPGCHPVVIAYTFDATTFYLLSIAAIERNGSQ